MVAEEEIHCPAAQGDAAATHGEIVHCAEATTRMRQGEPGGARMGTELIRVFGNAERADQADRAHARGFPFAEGVLGATPPARCELPPEIRRRRRRDLVPPCHVALDGPGFPEPGRRIAVDLEELPASVARPRPVEAREQAPALGRRGLGAERSDGLGNAEHAQQLGTPREMSEHAIYRPAKDERGMAELVPAPW